MSLTDIGRWAMALGCVCFILGAVAFGLGRLSPGPLQRMPLDVVIERPNVRIYFPLGWCLLLSGLLSLASWLWRRFQ